MAKVKTKFACTQCGTESPKWMGKCPGCQEWNTLVEDVASGPSEQKQITVKKNISIKRLTETVSQNSDRIVTSYNEFNRVMGGGIVRDSLTIITAVPGAGKSTLLLQISNDVASKGYKVLYASGEESDSQIKRRAERILPNNIHEDVWVYSDNSLNNVLGCIEEVEPDLIIIDSIQTFVLDEFPSRPGSPTQTMESATALLKIAKDASRPRAVIMVGQMTKDNELAGLRALEHLVDTVLILEGEEGEELKTLYSSKNRFAGTGEIGFFIMEETGLSPVDNPSEFFMTQRADNEVVSGSALTVVKEGTRAIILEIESLVSSTFMPYPSRIAECLKKDHVNTLISIMEQRAEILMHDKNVVVKTTGGMKLKEQSSNLAAIMSIVSSVKNIGIPNDVVFIADIGLTGELKKVPTLEMRIREVERMGFKKVYVASNGLKPTTTFKTIQVVPCKTLSQVIHSVFGSTPKRNNQPAPWDNE